MIFLKSTLDKNISWNVSFLILLVKFPAVTKMQFWQNSAFSMFIEIKLFQYARQYLATASALKDKQGKGQGQGQGFLAGHVTAGHITVVQLD